MGTSNSRFHEALLKGNTQEAYGLYYSNKSLRDSVLPNQPSGNKGDDSTVLHCTAKFGMKRLYIDLINHGGKPDQRNKQGKNCLHLICGQRRGKDRTDMLRFTLEAGLYGMDMCHVLEEKDEDGNTALHLAAACGLQECVELLVNCGANVFLTNGKEETAADCATKHNHTEIATTLETKMVFRPDDDQDPSLDPDPALLQEIADAPTGMRDKDLRTMKDELLIETVQLLGVSLFTAEALLRHNGWSKERLLECWMASPAEACEAAGVQLPSELGVDNLDQPLIAAMAVKEGGGGGGGGGGEEEEECGVCTLPSPKEVQVPCEHHFCRECWQQYLHTKIESGEAHSISCPEYGCYKLVPVEVIESVVSREMAEKYLHFDIKAFVDSNPNIRWCPHPGCGQAISMAPPTSEDMVTGFPLPSTDPAVTVHCGRDHYFCWGCSGEPHEPCDCEQWKTWLKHIEEMKPKIGDTTMAEVDEAASNKWLASRSKPCPKCRAPIERTEGCNHMCCRKCRHNFCWVCLDEWRCHNSSTGGYFECNRYDAKKKAEEMLHKRKNQVMSGLDEVEKLSRFMHYYERYKAHKESLSFEEPYLHKAQDKMEVLARCVQTMDHLPAGSISAGSLDLSFIKEAVRELLHSRRTLKASYGFGYYIRGNTARRMFENMQGALEEVTEMLAEVVARPHLRKPRSEIIRLTREAREKRRRLVRDVKTGLPSPSPPFLRRRRYPFFQDEGDRDSLSSVDSEEGFHDHHSHLMRLLEDLDRRRRSQERPHGHQQDDELQRALEISQQEYDDQKRLNADIELAKAISLRENQRCEEPRPSITPPSIPPLPSESDVSDHDLTWLHHPLGGVSTNSPTSLVPERDNESNQGLSWLHHSLEDASAHTPTNYSNWPILKLPPYPHQDRNLFNPHNSKFPSSPSPSPPSPPSRPSSDEPSMDDEGEGWGPVYGEEEDLRRAIEMSLVEQQEGNADSGVHTTSTDDSPLMTMMDISGPQFLDSNRLAVTPPPSPPPLHLPLNLPPELRHMLESSQRPGARV